MKQTLGPNEELIGQANGYHQLYTPSLVIELDAFERNVARMAAYCRDHGIACRPHAKTHKCVEIARRQIAAGASGVCCATLGEAEAMAAGGIENVLITTPCVGMRKINRYLDLFKRTSGLMMVLDNLDNVKQLETAAWTAGLKLDVLVALDMGLHRIGAEPGQAQKIARYMTASGNLTFRGVHAYCGNLQHIVGYEERKRAVIEANAIVGNFEAALKDQGIACELVTGVGTGSHQIDANHGTFNEMQCGSYIFMDVEYGDIEWPEAAYEQSLFVVTTVVSTNQRDFVTTDGGTKRFSMGGAAPRFADQDHWTYDFQGDEHGKIIFGNHNDVPAYGELVKVIPPHCDPTVNLYDHYHVVQDGRLVDIWPIEGRGAI